MAADVISVDLPMTFKRRGGRKVIVLPDGTQGNPAPLATIDSTMIKAIARAFRWQRLLENGTYGCLEEIARAEKIGASFVSRIIQLALLAPDIVEAILAGKQPASLTLKDLMAPFPVEWSGQRLQFGVGGGGVSASLPLPGNCRLQSPLAPPPVGASGSRGLERCTVA
jgi:hypothetical protein